MTHDLNDTLIFVKVVEQGSFIAAANALGLPKTTVSRKVQELETRLGARLLHRTTRRIGLTEAGSVYHEHCQRIARELEEAESAVGQLQSGPRGWLRFTVPYSLGITWIAPLLGEFHAQYPEIQLDMHLGNEKLDLIGGEADLALRVGALPDSNLVARKLGSLRTQVFASRPTSSATASRCIRTSCSSIARWRCARTATCTTTAFSGRSATAAMCAISRSIR